MDDHYSLSAAQQQMLIAVWGHERAATFAQQYRHHVDEALAAGFSPRSRLDGGIAGVAFAGSLDGERCVLKLSPHAAGVVQQNAALVLWGAATACRVLSSAGCWAIYAWAGQPAVPSTAQAYAQLCSLADAGSSPQFLPAYAHYRALIDLAVERPAALRFHTGAGIGRLHDLLELACDLTPNSSVAHGDCHDRNWLELDGVLTVIDPDPYLGHVAQDLARFVIGGELEAVTDRTVELADNHPGVPGLAAWIRFLARERAGARVHHGKPEAWGRQRIAAADTAAELYERATG